MPHPAPDHFDTLLCRLVDGILTVPEAAELELLMRADPQARDRYRLFGAIHLQLAAGHREATAGRKMPRPRRVAWPLTALAAAVVLLITGLALWWPPRGREQSRTAAVAVPVLGVTARAVGVSWDAPEPPTGGTKLRPGLITVAKGGLALDLVGGQSLTVRGPATFELINERELMLHSGDASLRTLRADSPYIIRVPGGAVVNPGCEVSVKVAADGTSQVHVFEGTANASVTGPGDSTREERQLHAGETLRIAASLEPGTADAASFLRALPPDAGEPSPAGAPYAAAVGNSGPLAWWRFEEVAAGARVMPEAGNQPLVLRGRPAILGQAGRRFLATDDELAAGFATTERAIDGLDSDSGLTVECLIFPVSEQYGTVIALDQPDLPPPGVAPFANVRHPPQRMVIERMGPSGSKIGHVHPDFALRAMMRSPAGYAGGINTYSSESHLFHRWVHVAFTHDGTILRLFIDGRESDHASAPLPRHRAALRPIIARLQPHPEDEPRQWCGGIDEVAVYDRPLSAPEIRAHHAALGR